MSSIDSLVSDQNLHFEHALLADPDNESLWLDYAELVDGDMLKSRFVLDRAVTRLPASTLLWNAYFLLPWSSQDKDKLLSVYKRALVVLASSPSIWMRYLSLWKDMGDLHTAKHAFDSALFHLDPQYHGPVWNLYLAVADELSGDEGANIYVRYASVCGDFPDGPTICLDDIALKLAHRGQFEQANSIFASLWTTTKPLSQMLSLATSEYCDLLLENEDFRNDVQFESIVLDAADMFPDMKAEFLTKLAQYYEVRGQGDQAVHFYNSALQHSVSVRQVTSIFEEFSKYLEGLIFKLQAKGKHLDHELDIYENLLNSRALYVNDVRLKENVNLVDYWLDRINILSLMDRKAEMLSAYVKAISSINPLKSSSTKGNTLATIWTQYADVYVAQGDLDTANIIFSRAIKSQFKSIDELVDIHIAWTETMLERSDEDAINHIMNLLKGSSDDQTEENELQHQLAQSPKLWEFRLDLLKAISLEDGSLQDPHAVLGDMIVAKAITLRILLDYASYLKSEQLWDNYFTALELGLAAFTLSDARYEIWKVYLPEFLARNSGQTERIRDIFEKCLEQVPPFQAKEFYLQYADFERLNKFINRSVRTLKQAITSLTASYTDQKVAFTRSELNQIADDKYDLYVSLVTLIEKFLKDRDMVREVFAKAVEDQHLTIPNTVDVCLRFIKFEISANDFPRVRALFKYATGLASPQQHTMKQAWKSWEEFELEHGDEESYKQMLKYKRTVSKDFEDLQEAKSAINPMGFTKSSTVVEEKTSNPDAINLDMDM